MCFFIQAQDDDHFISSTSQEIAVNAMLENARLELHKVNFKEAKKIINSASEIALDSNLLTNTKIVEIEYLIASGKDQLAQKELQILEELELNNSATASCSKLLSVDLLLKQHKYKQAEKLLKQLQVNNNNGHFLDLKYKKEYLQALLLLKTNRFNKAIAGFQSILKSHGNNHTRHKNAQVRLGLARTYFHLDQLTQAQTTTDQLIEIAQHHQWNSILLEAYPLKISILRKQNHYEHAMVYMDKYLHLQDSLFNTQQTYSTRSIAAAQSSNQGASKSSEYTNIMLFGVFTLLSLLTLSFYMNNRLRSKSNSTLKKANKALTEERDRAQDAAKIKADFLSTITHELRTPLYAVTGISHLLLEGNPREDQKEHIKTLQSSGDYLLSLIDNILNFNKLEANKVELESIPFNLTKRIKDLCNSLSQQAVDQGNQLHLDLDKDIPKIIQGDPVKISQILINLISNAIKFTKNGNVWIRAKLITTHDDKCQIHFEVEDNGKGISKDKQEDIFNNFSQEETSTTREYGGTGLGLAIVKNLIELMGSQIKLDSTIGRGSLFSFDIWLDLYHKNTTTTSSENHKNTDLEKPAQQVDNTPKEVIKITPAPAIELADKKILVVEDNKVNQMITRKILEGKNLQCDIANDGQQAVTMLQKNKYDLVLMDIHMPVMDGKEATVKIRTFNREIPIIALTAVSLQETEKELYELGFDDVISKPFKVAEFFEKIQKIFSNYEVL